MNIAVLETGFGTYHTELYAKMTDVEKLTVWGRNVLYISDRNSSGR